MNALIFDYDGLMIDTETCAAQVVVDLCSERGVQIELASLAPFVGGAGSEEELAWEAWILDVLGEEADPTAFDELIAERFEPLNQELPLLPGVGHLLDQARRAGVSTGIATSHQRDSLEASLRRLGIHDQFDAIVTSAEVPRPKPAPDVFLETARRLSVAPHACVALEDSVAGTEAALAAGMTVVVCPCEVTRTSKFPAAARRVDSLFELDLTMLLQPAPRDSVVEN
jgi:HAD superfamily hydrolase (TIGR01509 family)